MFIQFSLHDRRCVKRFLLNLKLLFFVALISEDLQSMATTGELSRVAFKAPIFWENDPELWFFQVESQFHISDIKTDSTKFHAVIAALNPSVLSCVRDLVRNPPTENAYGTLKDRILQHFAQSDASRLNLLLKDLQLGDKRPSHLLSEMRNLAPDKMEDDLLQTLWLQRLPTNLQQVLSVCTASLNELSQIADKIHEVSGQNFAVAKVESKSEIGILRAELAELKQIVQQLSARSQNRGRRRQRSLTPSGTVSGSKDSRKGLCWYHFRFAEKASKCQKPCNWNLN